jgi:hypothetical protein
MNIMCAHVLPFNWEAAPDYWYVVISGADPQHLFNVLSEMELRRPMGVFTADVRFVTSKAGAHPLDWLFHHVRARRSTLP